MMAFNRIFTLAALAVACLPAQAVSGEPDAPAQEEVRLARVEIRAPDAPTRSRRGTPERPSAIQRRVARGGLAEVPTAARAAGGPARTSPIDTTEVPPAPAPLPWLRDPEANAAPASRPEDAERQPAAVAPALLGVRLTFFHGPSTDGNGVVEPVRVELGGLAGLRR